MKFSLIVSACLLSLVLLAPVQEANAELINVNTATAEQLSAVPGMNAEIAAGIIQYRTDMGDIQSLDELTEIPGISKDLLGKLKEFIGLDAISGAECSC